MANDKASLLLGYYQANGATSDDLQDAEREFLIGQGVTVAANQDMWYELLLALGYTGALQDMLHDFWCTGGGSIGGESVTFGGDPDVTFGGEEVIW